MTDHLSNVLIDQNDINIITFDKLTESIFNVTYAGVLIHNKEVRLAMLVDLTNTTKEESHTSILISNNCQQFSFHSRMQCHFLDSLGTFFSSKFHKKVALGTSGVCFLSSCLVEFLLSC
uniref:Uncharacterized protein n=1 Tax=Cacopsylla melanoneura TaxID=428564 RepID=A0A8D8U5F7_9HEMI